MKMKFQFYVFFFFLDTSKSSFAWIWIDHGSYGRKSCFGKSLFNAFFIFPTGYSCFVDCRNQFLRSNVRTKQEPNKNQSRTNKNHIRKGKHNWFNSFFFVFPHSLPQSFMANFVLVGGIACYLHLANYVIQVLCSNLCIYAFQIIPRATK